MERKFLTRKFERLPRFRRKIGLYSWRKFSIFELCTNIQLLRGFDGDF